MKGRDGETGRKLSPSLLSAPWRTQLLILAGDVELNPGPSTTKYGKDQLQSGVGIATPIVILV